MRLIFGLVLIVGIGLAGFATYMAKNYIDQYRQQLAEERAQRGPAIETLRSAAGPGSVPFSRHSSSVPPRFSAASSRM